MDYNYDDPSCVERQPDLIDFLPESSVDDSWSEPSNETNAELPVLKSKDRGRINSDVVAIKSGSGDIGFVAVGRPNIEQQKQDLHVTKRKKHRKSRSDAEKMTVPIDSLPRIIAPPSERGIDNLGYTTISRNESYTYDDTGFNYYSQLERWDNSEFLNLDQNSAIQQPQYVAVESSQTPESVFSDLGIRRVSYDNVPSTSQQITTTVGAAEEPTPLVVLESSTPQPHQMENATTSDASVSNTSGNFSRRPSADFESVPTEEPKEPSPKAPPLCKTCGQNHGVTENHEYNYIDEVDEDLMCDICLQPLVEPYDTKCGHTFCSICIKNYLRVKHICPVDRVELSSSDCWQSSLILRKLVNKLMVTCPHEKLCDKKLQRCDLKDHLQDICPGAIVRCPKSMYGCSHKCARVNVEGHLEDCLFKEFNDKLSDLHPFSEDVTVELFRPEGTAELGIMVVGGCDTPIHYIMIQDIVKDSLAGQDGRLHVGDIIVEVNGEPLFSVTHAEARAALTKPSNIMRFTLLRDIVTNEAASNIEPCSLNRSVSFVSHKDEYVCLIKPPLEQLGIRISSNDSGEKGVYIIELIPGQVAETDGRLQVGDRIMKIGNCDLTDSTPEQAAKIISSCDREVKIMIRHFDNNVILNEWAGDATVSKPTMNGSKQNTMPGNSAITRQDSRKATHTRKVISVLKSPKENLGIIVSGGNGSPRGNLPIFVQDVLPLSVLGKDKRIKRGDLLAEINNIKLTGLSHTQAMSVLRESAQQREVTLVAYELDYAGKAEDTALWDELTSLHQNPSKWAPSWKMWLAANREFSAIREIILRKSQNGNYGFKISGGHTNESGPSPIYVTHISRMSLASKHLKCGDEIIAINKRPVKDLPYLQVLNLMRASNCIFLKIVSWPGSLH